MLGNVSEYVLGRNWAWYRLQRLRPTVDTFYAQGGATSLGASCAFAPGSRPLQIWITYGELPAFDVGVRCAVSFDE